MRHCGSGKNAQTQLEDILVEVSAGEMDNEVEDLSDELYESNDDDVDDEDEANPDLEVVQIKEKGGFCSRRRSRALGKARRQLQS